MGNPRIRPLLFQKRALSSLHKGSFSGLGGLTPDQLSFQAVAEEFARNEFAPHADKWDEEKIFPKEALRKAAELGFAGIYVSEESGGTGLSRVDASIVFEALASACTSTTAYLTIHNMVCFMIDAFGNQEQKQKWLPNLINMQVTISFQKQTLPKMFSMFSVL